MCSYSKIFSQDRLQAYNFPSFSSFKYIPTQLVIKGKLAVKHKIHELPYLSNNIPDEYDDNNPPIEEAVQQILCKEPDKLLEDYFSKTLVIRKFNMIRKFILNINEKYYSYIYK